MRSRCADSIDAAALKVAASDCCQPTPFSRRISSIGCIAPLTTAAASKRSSEGLIALAAMRLANVARVALDQS